MTGAQAVSLRLGPEESWRRQRILACVYGSRPRTGESPCTQYTGPSTPGASPTYQQGGAPQMYRIAEDSSERQLRPGREDFDKSSWTWDRNKLQ